MGGLGGIGTADQGWFAGCLAESCARAGVCGIAELEVSAIR